MSVKITSCINRNCKIYVSNSVQGAVGSTQKIWQQRCAEISLPPLKHLQAKNLYKNNYLCPPLKNTCRVGQGVKTPPFHGGITGSNPVRGTLLKAERPSCIGFQAVFLFQSINIVTKVAETVSF